jgi:hypothetical protein
MKKTAKSPRLADLSTETNAVKGGGIGVPGSPRGESAVNREPGVPRRSLSPCV